MGNRITNYKIFESNLNTQKEIRTVLYETGLFAKSKINSDLTVDVRSDINYGLLFAKFVVSKPLFKFNVVDGSFGCMNCELNNLSLAPNYVTGNFNCSFNNLKHLNDLPKIIGGELICHDNNITYITTEIYKKLRTRIESSLVDNPIYDFIMYLVRRLNINNSTSYLNGLEVVERLDEFDVIKNINEIDMISLNNLFDFYNIPFDKVQQHLKSMPLTNSSYKFI